MTEIILNMEQQQAIDLGTDVSNRIVSVTGPAGTGKTTIIKKIMEQLLAKGRTPALAAPTGRAARRIYESTGFPAVTVHKLLAYSKPEQDAVTGEVKDNTDPGFHSRRRLPYTDVIVDEYAMVNEELHNNLMHALPVGGRLLTFGDKHQLPPIEKYEMQADSGKSPFQRLLELRNTIELTVVFRQDGESGILKNALRVKAGQPVAKNKDFDLIITESPIQQFRKLITDGMVDYRLLDNQVITPSKVGKLGTYTLNQVAQSIYNPQTESYMLSRQKWDEKFPVIVHVGEKVMCTENTYDMRDFFHRFGRFEKDEPVWETFIPTPDNAFMLNGEIGIVTDISVDGTIEIDLGDRHVQVPSSYREFNKRYNKIYEIIPSKRLDLAYVVSTHKMQGSECRNVLYITHNIQWASVNRNNIYTAITRAKDRVVYITDSKTWRNGSSRTAQEKSKMMNERKREKEL